MPEIIWRGGAAEDLCRIFAELEDFREGAGERFVLGLDGVLENLRAHPALAPVFEPPMCRLIVGNTGYGVFYAVEARGLIIDALVDLRQHSGRIRARIMRLLGLR